MSFSLSETSIPPNVIGAGHQLLYALSQTHYKYLIYYAPPFTMYAQSIIISLVFLAALCGSTLSLPIEEAVQVVTANSIASTTAAVPLSTVDAGNSKALVPILDPSDPNALQELSNLRFDRREASGFFDGGSNHGSGFSFGGLQRIPSGVFN